MRMLPSISSTPLHMQSRLRIVLNSWRSFPNMILRRFFGTQAVWYLHSHTVCDKLFLIHSSFRSDQSRVQPRPILRQGAFLRNTTAQLFLFSQA
jgi:hypothetical protein